MPDEKKIKQRCATCRHWDRQHKEKFNGKIFADCKYPIPLLPESLGTFERHSIKSTRGKKCSVWEEYKKPGDSTSTGTKP
jgi:hypothetical protein